jgi:Fe-S-cluster containining protein
MTTPPAPKPKQEWFAPDGVRFECTQCGACCTGPEGYVGVTDEEIAALARLREMSVEEFREVFTRDTEDGVSLVEVQTYHGYDCVFLDRTTIPGKAVCGVYEARPLQCRTFPWWPGVMKSRATWERLGRECEGVGRGGFVPVEEIRINRDLQAKRDGGVSR